MALVRLTNPVIIINQQQITPVSNSIEVDPGYIERKVEGVAAGGGFVDIVVSEDFSTAIGIVKFKFYNDVKQMAQYDFWQTFDPNIGSIISITDAASDFASTWPFMIIVNKNNIPLSFDGEFDLEFHGRPAIRV